MPDETETETMNTATPGTGGQKRPWPMWLASGITVVAAVAAVVSSDATLLAGRTGWEAAIDRDAVTEAIADCDPEDG